VSLKLKQNKLYYKLNNNNDSDYKLIFNLNAKLGDTVQMTICDIDSYYYMQGPTRFKFDTIKFEIAQINTRDYQGRKLRTWSFFANNVNMSFIDSVGFSSLGVSQFKAVGSYLDYVCSDEKLFYKRSSGTNIKSCNTDSFLSSGYIDFVKHPIFEINTFVLYPNPAINFLSIKSKNAMPQNFDIKILDAQGRLILDKKGLITDGDNISMGSVSYGIYQVIIYNPLLNIQEYYSVFIGN